MKTTTLVLAGAALLLPAIPQANAQTFTYADNWINWPGYTSPLSGDENGTPKIDHMDVTISGGYLDAVSIVLHDSTSRQAFDSLFISTDGAWDSWDYFVHDGGTRDNVSTGNVPGDGLYEVSNNYAYTMTTTNRKDNPNGIDAGSLNMVDNTFGATQDGHPYEIVYDFTNLSDKIVINPDEFFIAYAPWCDNDIIGGGTAPVPEPATMLLFGTGLAGLATVGRKKMKRD